MSNSMKIALNTQHFKVKHNQQLQVNEKRSALCLKKPYPYD